MIRSYLELIDLDTFDARFEYLKLNSHVGLETFGSGRWLNQVLYHDPSWKETRYKVILRDSGCDLAVEGRNVIDKIYIHHINPITKDDVINRSPCLFDMNNLVCCSFVTHNAIHYGSSDGIVKDPITRVPNDTCPWKNLGGDLNER